MRSVHRVRKLNEVVSTINTDRKAAAWKFIKYMLSDEAQKIGATVNTISSSALAWSPDGNVIAFVDGNRAKATFAPPICSAESICQLSAGR